MAFQEQAKLTYSEKSRTAGLPVGLGLVWNVTKAPWENVGVVLINVLCLDRDLGSTVCIFVKTQGMYS